jgi:hypothetical protein
MELLFQHPIYLENPHPIPTQFPHYSHLILVVNVRYLSIYWKIDTSTFLIVLWLHSSIGMYSSGLDVARKEVANFEDNICQPELEKSGDLEKIQI